MKNNCTTGLFGASILVSLLLIWTVNYYAELHLNQQPSARRAPEQPFSTRKQPIRFPNFTRAPTNNTHPTNWLVAEVTRGRLGNNMFQYGSAYGVFRDKLNSDPNLSFCVADRKRPKFRDLNRFYQGPFAPVCDPSVKYTKELNETGYGTYTNFSIPHQCGGVSSGGGCATVIREYLISYRYFDHIKPEMQHMYELKGRAKKRQRDDFLKQFRSHSSGKKYVLVGIHVRRTDIARDKSYRNPPTSYYEKAMKYFTDKYGEDTVRFIVASDDKRWCARQPLFANKNGTVVIVPDTFEPVTEMAVLKRCNHMILSIGTFGWWAAYLGSGEVIYWKQVFDMEHEKHKEVLNLDDYYPANWIGFV